MMKPPLTRRQLLAGFSIASAALVAKPVWAGRDLPHYIETTPPQPLPALTFRDEAGRNLTLDNYRGRVVLLSVWATWCVPCVIEMPSLDKLQREMGGANFTVLPLATDRGGVEKVRRFYNEKQIQSLPILVDRDLSVARKLQPRGFPLSILINRAGQEIGRSLGEGDWAGAEAKRLIKTALEN